MQVRDTKEDFLKFIVYTQPEGNLFGLLSKRLIQTGRVIQLLEVRVA